MYKVLSNARIFTGQKIITDKSLLINDEIIEGFIPKSNIPAEADSIDCGNNIVAPGFIDLQIAGAGGYLFSSNLNGKSLYSIAESILKSGTTGFLIVLPTNTPDVYHRAIKTIKENPHSAVLGLHLEGPFINPSRRGAHAVNYIKIPDRKEVDAILKDTAGIVKMVTLAPELCSKEIIGQIADHGIVVCAGHSNATYEEAMNGFSWGIKAVTHLFNAMSPLHHRDTGLPGATFNSDNIMASIVADGIHVDYSMLSIAKRIMKERLYLISDAVEQSSEEAVHHIRHKDRFTLPDGTLSGSALTMMKAVQNCVEKAGINMEEALRMAGNYPAKLMNLNHNGRIEKGYKADLVVFDKDFEIRIVIKEGNIIINQ